MKERVCVVLFCLGRNGFGLGYHFLVFLALLFVGMTFSFFFSLAHGQRSFVVYDPS
jgi:hypothetical protein